MFTLPRLNQKLTPAFSPNSIAKLNFNLACVYEYKSPGLAQGH